MRKNLGNNSKGKQVQTYNWEQMIGISYQQLFCLWLALIAIFSVIYFVLTTYFPSHGLTGLHEQIPLRRLGNSIYFSIITTTSVGFGDIVPLGLSRIIASIHSIMTIFLSALLISKLISYKQETAIYQMHKLTFDDIFSGTREGFFIIRQDFDHLIEEAKSTGKLSEDAQETMATAFKQGQSLLDEILEFYDEHANMYTLDIRREQLLLEAVNRTLRRIHQLIETFREKGMLEGLLRDDLKELREFVRITTNIIPLWQERSPYREEGDFMKITHTIKRIRASIQN